MKAKKKVKTRLHIKHAVIIVLHFYAVQMYTNKDTYRYKRGRN